MLLTNQLVTLNSVNSGKSHWDNPEPSPWRGEGAETKFSIGKEELAYASLMGDGWIVKKGSHFHFTQCCKNFEYVDFIASLFERYWIIKKYKRYFYNPKYQKNYCQMGFRTNSYPYFKHLRTKVFYKNGKKEVNQRILSKITPLGLAIWYMDDGTFNKREAELSTQGYTFKENNIIKDYFQRKWDIKCRVVKRCNSYLSIQFNTGNTIKLFQLIKSYIVPCMYYKIDFKSTYNKWLPRSKYKAELLKLYG